MSRSTIAFPRRGRKDFGGHPVHRAPHHIAAAWTYRSLCSRKRLAHAWGTDLTTAGRYRNGAIVGALSRLLWEVVLLERAGIATDEVHELVRRAAIRERRARVREGAPQIWRAA